MKKSKNKENKGNVFAGLLIGAISGAALGLLFAPSNGRKTRDKLSEEANRMTHDFKERVTKETESIRDKAMRFIGYTEAKAEKFANETKERARQKAEETSKKAENMKQDI